MKRVFLIMMLSATLFLGNEALYSQSTGFCWVDQTSSTGTAFANDIVEGDFNFFFVVGQFRGTVTFGENDPNETTLTSTGKADGFIAKYNNDGDLIWAIKAGEGLDDNSLNAGDYHFNDELVVVGQFTGSVTFGAGGPNQTILTSAGGQDIFIAKYDGDHNFIFAVRAGGPDGDRGLGVQVDFDGIVVTGLFRELAFFETRSSPAVGLESAGGSDIFLVKYDIDATEILWARAIGGAGDDRGEGLVEGDNALQYVAGEFAGEVDFGDTHLKSAGGGDMFVAKFDPFDGTFIWANRAGGSDQDRGSNLDVGPEVNSGEMVFVTGWFIGVADFGSQTLVAEGDGDSFIAAYDEDGNFQFARGAGGSSFDSGVAVAAEQVTDDNGPQFATAQVVGEFQGSITFAKGDPNETTLTSAGQKDVFIAKYNQLGQFLWAKRAGGPGNESVRGIFSKEFGFFSDEFGESVPLQNTFIAGSFENSVEFGTLPPTNVTSQNQTAVFVTRLSDFLRPINLGLEQIENTPYLLVTWDPPFNAISPIIKNPQIQNLNSNCTFDDGGTGTTFRIAVDYFDVNDGDVNNQTRVTVPSVFTQLGGQVELQSGTPSIGGNGFSGTVAFNVCIQFALEDTVDVSCAIRDAAGNVSNFLTLSVAKPVGNGNPGFRVRTHGATSYDLPDDDEAITLNCGASVRLQGYNVFRQKPSTNEDIFLSFVTAEQTIFVDEVTEPGTAYLYRVTAVYAEGESEHLGAFNQSDNPTADDLFDKVTNAEITHGGGFSLAGAWGDFNNDGLLDLFVPNFANRDNLLFQNNGGGSFTQILTGPVVTDGGNSYSASWGDYNNDGLLDLFVANAAGNGLGQKNFLYKNLGGSFEKVTAGAIANDVEESNSGVWGDYNNDGFLDLYVANSFQKRNSLYRNQGDGTFEKISTGALVTDLESSFSAMWWDYDDDKDLDLFVANNGKNSFYRNDGAPNFTFAKLTAAQVGVWLDDVAFSRGASSADYNNDGYLDLFIANSDAKSVLLKNDGPPNFSFTKVTQGAVVNNSGSSFGSGWGDFDNDGDVDLFVSNFDRDIFNTQANSNFLYFNDGAGNFTELDPPRGNLLFDIGASNGCSWADYDSDGFLDMFVSNGTLRAGENLLYKNNRQQGSNSNNRISVRCIGSRGPGSAFGTNKSAIGAKVRVKVNVGGNGVWQMQEISGQTGGGWGGQNSLNVEFGLGAATQIDSLVIEWPNSADHQILTNVTANQSLTVTEPQAINQPPSVLNDQVSSPEDAEIIISVLDNDDDPENQPLAITDVTPAEHGSVIITQNEQAVKYTPNENFNGSDSFNYTARDDQGLTASASVTVQVTPVNDAPQLSAIANQTLTAGETIAIEISASDPDDDETLQFTLTAGPAWVAINKKSNSSGGGNFINLVDNMHALPDDKQQASPLILNTDNFSGTANLALSESAEIVISPPISIQGDFSVSVAVKDLQTAADIDTFSIHVNPKSGENLTSVEHTAGGIKVTLQNNGLLQQFSFQGDNVSGIGGIIVATAPNRVAVNLEVGIQNFENVSGFSEIFSDAAFDEITECQYDEKGSILAGNPMGVRITQTSFARHNQDFLLLQLDISNPTAANISNVFVGQIADWDIGQRAANRGGYDSKRNLIYQFEQGGDTPNYCGLQVLEGPSVLKAAGARLANVVVASPDSLFAFISNFDGPGPLPITSSEDYRSFIGAGPLTLAPGESKLVGFAWLAGESLGELQGAADEAQEVWDDILVSVENSPIHKPPIQFTLEQNYPNPFNPETKIRYTIFEKNPVRLIIYNMLGQQVRTLVDEKQGPGFYEVIWDGKDEAGAVLTSGIYFCKLNSRHQNLTRKMVLLR